MQYSKCPNPECNQHSFEMVTESVSTGGASTKKIRLVRCSKCGTVVGALDKDDLEDIVKKILGK